MTAYLVGILTGVLVMELLKRWFPPLRRLQEWLEESGRQAARRMYEKRTAKAD